MTKTRRPKRKRAADDDDPSDIIDKLNIDINGDVPSYPPSKRPWLNRESAKFGESTEWESAEWESAKWESAKWESAKWESAQWESAKFGESAKVREPTRFTLPLRSTKQYKQDIKIEKEDVPMEDLPMKDSGSCEPRSKTNSGSDAIMFTVEEAWNALRASNVADAHPRNIRYDLPTGEFLSYPVERSYNLGAMGRYVRKKRACRWD